MKFRQLHTFHAILEHGSFSAAGEHVGLSHSAVSVQIKQLEDDLGITLFDRNTRPPSLTTIGERVALLTRDVLNQVENIRATAAGRIVSSRISIGLVPTTLQTILPVVLSGLRAEYPNLQVIVKSALSGDLATQVARKELDFAILSAPTSAIMGVEVTDIAIEPIYVIGPRSQAAFPNDAALLRSMPFLSFSKKSWLGQKIAARLQSRGIHINEVMELDSFNAIEKLVKDGFGVSIVPQRFLAPPLSQDLVRIPFGRPAESRKLVMIQPAQEQNARIGETIKQIFSTIGQSPEATTPHQFS